MDNLVHAPTAAILYQFRELLAGRITRYPLRKTEKVPATPHRDITLMRRWMDAMGVRKA